MKKIKMLFLAFALGASMLSVQAADYLELNVKNATYYDAVVINGAMYVKGELTCRVPGPGPFNINVQYWNGTNGLIPMGDFVMNKSGDLVCSQTGFDYVTEDYWEWFGKGAALSILVNGFCMYARNVKKGIFGNVATSSCD